LGLSPLDADGEAQLINRIAKGTKVITFDSDAPQSKRLLYIGTNNYEAGRVLGGEIVKLLPSGGNMAAFVGSFSADNAAQRLKGIQDATSGHHIVLVDRREDGTDRGKARSNVEDIVNAHRDLSLVAGLWSYNGPAIAAALQSLGKKGQVLAAVFDEESGTLDAIADGTIACTVVQKPFQFGYLASKWMHDLATKGAAARAAIPSGQVIDTGVDVITKAIVAEFSRQLAELKR
jgi:ribose transport system substrate-binding protein